MSWLRFLAEICADELERLLPFIGRLRRRKEGLFCILPWIHLNVVPDGKVYPCCMAANARHGLPVADLADMSLESAWNSEGMKRIRRDMLAGAPGPRMRRLRRARAFRAAQPSQAQQQGFRPSFSEGARHRREGRGRPFAAAVSRHPLLQHLQLPVPHLRSGLEQQPAGRSGPNRTAAGGEPMDAGGAVLAPRRGGIFHRRRAAADGGALPDPRAADPSAHVRRPVGLQHQLLGPRPRAAAVGPLRGRARAGQPGRHGRARRVSAQGPGLEPGRRQSEADAGRVSARAFLAGSDAQRAQRLAPA